MITPLTVYVYSNALVGKPSEKCPLSFLFFSTKTQPCQRRNGEQITSTKKIQYEEGDIISALLGNSHTVQQSNPIGTAKNRPMAQNQPRYYQEKQPTLFYLPLTNLHAPKQGYMYIRLTDTDRALIVVLQTQIYLRQVSTIDEIL